MLVVVLIISLLVGILLPVLGKAREAARKTQVKGQLTNLGLAIESYHTQFEGYPGPVPDRPTGRGSDNLGSTIDGHDDDGIDTVSACENLVFGLLGCVAHDDDTKTRLFTAEKLSQFADKGSARTTLVDGPYARLPHEDDLDASGSGTPAKRLAPFYAPSERELGDADADGRPEILEVAQSGLPILYFRARTTSQVLYVEDDDDDIQRSAYDYRQNSEYWDYLPYIPNHERLVAQVWDWRRSDSANITNPDTDQLKEDLRFLDVEGFALDAEGEPALRGDSYALITSGQDRVYANSDETLDAGEYVLPAGAGVPDVEADNLANLR
jgi:type II secretory pathway pseudopilin PulG